MNRTFAAWLFALLLAAVGCSARQAPVESLTLATTTSAQDSGLLELLLPLFREETGIEVRAVAVGSGQALALGRRGDADVLLVHDPAGEQQFMDDGHGLFRREVFYNDFLLAGPAAGPPGRKGQAPVDQP